MSTQRLEAFSDCVMSIIITIMVLELKAPHEATWACLKPVLPVFFGYVLSFVFVGIYWNNHHHLMQLTPRVNGAILWANLHLLFWLSLIPFVTEWTGQAHLMPLPTAAYGVVLLMAAVGFYVLQLTIKADDGPDSLLAYALGRDWKGKTSLALYVAGVAVAFSMPSLAGLFYVAVALMWLIPDRRMERAIEKCPKSVADAAAAGPRL